MEPYKDLIIKTKKVRWKELIPFQPENLKSTTPEIMKKLKTSLKNNGFAMPFHVWQKGKKLYCIDGHHRIKALNELVKDGEKIPEMVSANFLNIKDEKQGKNLILIFNSYYAKLTKNNLKEYIIELDISKIISEINIDIDVENIIQSEANEDDYDIPDDIKTNIKSGDVIQIGNHRLICGDSTKIDLLNKLCSGNMADMVFTDPPYGVSIGKKNVFLNSFQPSGRNLKTIKNDNIKVDELENILIKSFTNMKTVLNDCCSIFVCAPQGGELGMMMMAMKNSGLPVRHVLIWKKNCPTFSMGRLDYEYQHEPILLCFNKTHKFYGNGKYKTSVWDIDKPMKNKEHPTMKPVALIENAILNNSKENDIILDLFIGSGSTMVASHQLNRVCYGIEIEPIYCQVVIDRMKKLDPAIKIMPK